MKKVTFALILAAAGAAALHAQQPAAPAPAQEPPPVTFRVEVNYVELDALVTDAQGNIVSNLTTDDFEVIEDGKPQKVSAFSLVNIPIERAERPLYATAAVEPDVQTNPAIEGRIYLLVLDDLHIDPVRAPRVKTAARRFIQQNFGINDLAAVVYTGGRSSDAQDFTNNPRLLLNAIDKFSGRKLRSATLERLDNTRIDPTTGSAGPGDDLNEQERAFKARSVMSNVRKLAEFMAGVRGRRKAMLLISEGVDYNIFNAVGQEGSTASSVLSDTHDAIAAATRGNVHIYGIDPRGLTSGTEDLIEASSTFDDVGARSMQNELRLSQDSLRVLAAETGGFAAVNQNDFNNAFDRIVRENSTYYLLGYYPTNERRDGKFRKVQVRLKNHPGLVVRSRSGYSAPRGRAPQAPTPPGPNAMSPALAEAIGSPLPVSGLPIKVFAAPFKGTPPNASVALAVEVDVSKLDFVVKDGNYTEKLNVVNSATDTNGKVYPGLRQTIGLALKPDTYRKAQENGFRMLSQVDLPPGRYQLRIAAGNDAGKVGSVIYDLEIPDFNKAPLTMSGVALTSLGAQEVPTARPKDPLRDFLPGPATAGREFATGDTISMFGEIYESSDSSQAHMIEIKTELRGDDGRVIRSTSEQRSSTELQGKTGGYGFTPKVPLSDLKPGIYVIHIGAQSTLGSRPSVNRDIQIRVK